MRRPSPNRETAENSAPDRSIRRALDAISDPRRLLEALFEQAPTAFQILSAGGHSIICNRAFRELFGSEPPADWNVFKDDFVLRLGLLEPVQRAFAGEIVRLPVFWYDPRELRSVSVSEGRRVAVEVTFIPLPDERGRVQHVAQCCKDMTSIEQLHESRKRLMKAQRVAGLGFWDWDLTSQTIAVSEEVYQICGLVPNDGLETPAMIERVVHPDDVATVRTGIERAIEGQREFDLDVRVKRPDGEIRWVNTAAELARDDQGKPLSLLGTLLDITHRKHVEEVLRASEQRHRSLNQLGEAIHALSDPEQIAPAALRVLGEQLQLSRCALASLEPDADGLTIVCDYARDRPSVPGRGRLSAFGASFLRELTSGKTVIVRDVDRELPPDRAAAFSAIDCKACVCSPLLREGTFHAVLAVQESTPRDWSAAEIALIQEVGERAWHALEQRAAAAALREKEALLHIASRIARMGGWSIELFPEVRINWSDEVCAIHDMPPGTLPDMDQALNFFAPECRAPIHDKITQCVDEGTPFDIELQLISARGRRLWVRAIGQAQRNSAGAITRIQGALQDIDERRRLEDQLRHAQKMDAIGQLAGGVAHDFNNLLSVILSYSALIGGALPPDHPIRADLEEITRAGERASELTRRLLAFGRLQMLQPRVIDLNQSVCSMENMLRRLLGETIALSVHAHARAAQVRADPGQIEQVIMNLVINARDAMPAGGALTLETADADFGEDRPAALSGVPPGRYALLIVSDTGTGMTDATRARIFEPFFTTKDKAKGTGLGLSTVHGIVTQSGGYVRVQSELGRGTSFEIYLPHVDTAGLNLSAAAPKPRPNLRGSETILVVDDEQQVRALLCSILRRNGYDVLEAQNGGEAFLICEQQPSRIHLMLSDVVMPRMSGRELAERVAPMRPDMAVLFMSGYTEDAIVHDGVHQAELNFIPKPLTPEALLRKVREVLDRAGVARKRRE